MRKSNRYDIMAKQSNIEPAREIEVYVVFEEGDRRHIVTVPRLDLAKKRAMEALNSRWLIDIEEAGAVDEIIAVDPNEGDDGTILARWDLGIKYVLADAE